jgi:secreted PhoX family phosphatase
MDIERVTNQRAREEAEDVGRNPSAGPTMGDVIAARYNRRDLLKNALAVTAISATMGPLRLAPRRARRARPRRASGSARSRRASTTSTTSRPATRPRS